MCSTVQRWSTTCRCFLEASSSVMQMATKSALHAASGAGRDKLTSLPVNAAGRKAAQLFLECLESFSVGVMARH